MQNTNDNNQKTNPINTKKEVDQSNDHKIDQDFNNFPHDPSKEDIINPKTHEDFVVADAEDAENRGKDGINELDSDGSGGAFGSTEEVAHNYGKHTNVKENRRIEGAEDY